MDGWFKYEKDFEEVEKKDMRGVIFMVYYESLKRYDFCICYKFFCNFSLN